MSARYLAPLLFATVLGCGLDPATKPEGDQTTKPVVTGSITAEMKAARAESTKQLRESLTRIAEDVEAGRIEYDTKLDLEMNAATVAASAPINDVKSRYLPKGKIDANQRKPAADALRQIRDGYQ